MSAMRIATVVLVVAVGLGLAASAALAQQVKIPADFGFDKGKDSPGAVTFSHEKHKEKADKCTACHVKVFKMKKGTSGALTMAAMKEGKLCGTCHDGKTQLGGAVVFAADDKANCEKCHRK